MSEDETMTANADAAHAATEAPEGRDSDGAEEPAFEQFVTFFLEDECFAFPMRSVREIIRAPSTVDVPLTPPALVGLANLRGAVLPVVDLRIALGMPQRPFDDSSRAVVVDCGRPIALMVDRVWSVLDIDPSRVESAEAAAQVAPNGLLTGVVKDVDGQELIQLLDADGTVAREFSAAALGGGGEGGGSTSGLGAGFGEAEPEDDETSDSADQLVSLQISDQEYAFEISEVDEIVRMPERITSTPHASSYALGLINLRGRLLPLVSLRRIFGLQDAEPSDQHRIVVARLFAGEGAGKREAERVGVVVDHVREVLRVPRDERSATPRLAHEADGPVASVCQLENGERLVGVLSAATLIDHPGLQEAIALRDAAQEAAGDDTSRDDEDAMSDYDGDQLDGDQLDDDAPEDDDEQLVVYLIGGQEYGVQIKSVQEIIRVPETLTEVPQAPCYIEGMINLRGAVLPVASMRARFGLDSVERNDRQRIIVLTLNETRMGFIVDSVTEVLRVPDGAVERAPALSEEQDRLVGRIANLDAGARMIMMLDAEALLGGAEGAAADLDALDLEELEAEAAA